jgi:hypothetical protein
MKVSIMDLRMAKFSIVAVPLLAEAAIQVARSFCQVRYQCFFAYIKNVIAYLSNTKIIIVNMFLFLKPASDMKIENVDFVNHIVNNTLFLTLGTPNSGSL